MAIHKIFGVKDMKIKNRVIWICSPVNIDGAAVDFKKYIRLDQKVKAAKLCISAIGVYDVHINGKKVGERVLAPGFTSYKNRVLYQSYDVTDMLCKKNSLCITAAPGWAVGHIGYDKGDKVFSDKIKIVAELTVTYEDGSIETVCTDESWSVYTSEVTYSDIYMGETVDKTHSPSFLGNAATADGEYNLIADMGEEIREQEILSPCSLITTPKGEKVIDFGQNMTGYVSLKIKGVKGERVKLSFAEVLDSNGNFYNANYRSAKNEIVYILSGNEDIFKPRFSFQGFRYVRIEEYPNMDIDLNAFRAIVVHSDMKRTGNFVCGNEKINQLYHNIIWGQKSNYLDIPTDCPQRDERLGWTGDAQVFCRTAALNFDVRKFFDKWLGDLRTEQREDGAVWGTCPESYQTGGSSRIATGWGDAATIIPWTLYEIYGDKKILEDNFDMMRGWVDYMHSAGEEEYLWLGGYHYGDWLAMDAGEDSYVGATSNDLIASAFFAYSTELFVKAGEALGKDMTEYRELHKNVVTAFREYFMENGMPKKEFPLTEIVPPNKKSVCDTVRCGITQTALVLILRFGLCTEDERPAIADKLEELIHEFGDRMATGFIGTPHILHALSENGKQELAYKLLFNENVPSWLYSVNHGATTMWEHWNGIKEDGSFWSDDMNSFNHYAYGAVGDWLYGVVAGIKIKEAGYSRVTLKPKPDKRLGFVKCSLDTIKGVLESNWYYKEDSIIFEINVPRGVIADIVLPNGQKETVTFGRYMYSVRR